MDKLSNGLMGGKVKFKYEPAQSFEIKAGWLWLACIVGLGIAFFTHLIWPLILMSGLSQWRMISNNFARLLYPDLVTKLDKVANAARLTDRDKLSQVKRYSHSVIFDYYQDSTAWRITVYANGITHSDNVADLTLRFGEVFGVTPYIIKRKADSITYQFPINSETETLSESEF